MASINLTQANFVQEVEKATKPVVIDVYASWCGPCQQMQPIFAALEKEMGETYKFVQLNVDEARELSIKFGITSVPTFLFVKNNQVMAKKLATWAKMI